MADPTDPAVLLDSVCNAGKYLEHCRRQLMDAMTIRRRAIVDALDGGVTQAEVAKALRVSRAYVGQVAAGVK